MKLKIYNTFEFPIDVGKLLKMSNFDITVNYVNDNTDTIEIFVFNIRKIIKYTSTTNWNTKVSEIKLTLEVSDYKQIIK